MHMQHFTIQIGPRGAPRLAFEAMAPDSATAAAQHAELAQPGERLEVTPAQRMRAELQELANEIKARSAKAWAVAPRPVAQQPARVEQQYRPYISTAYSRCSLCGSTGHTDGVCYRGPTL
jgi:hypothetical protein